MPCLSAGVVLLRLWDDDLEKRFVSCEVVNLIFFLFICSSSPSMYEGLQQLQVFMEFMKETKQVFRDTLLVQIQNVC